MSANPRNSGMNDQERIGLCDTGAKEIRNMCALVSVF